MHQLFQIRTSVAVGGGAVVLGAGVGGRGGCCSSGGPQVIREGHTPDS